MSNGIREITAKEADMVAGGTALHVAVAVGVAAYLVTKMADKVADEIGLTDSTDWIQKGQDALGEGRPA